VKTVRLPCEKDETFTVFAASVTLHLNLTDLIYTASAVCPFCQEPRPLVFDMTKEAMRDAWKSLCVLVGHVHQWTTPAELREPRDGPRLTKSDESAFILAIRATSYPQTELQASS
jgi:hypothetical protein